MAVASKLKPTPMPRPNIQNSTPSVSVKKIDAISVIDFIKNLLEFQKAFLPDTVISAFTKALQEHRLVSMEIDRIHILYKNILFISKYG